MKIQLLAGGLANQIRRYVFVRFAERYHPEERWFYDDSEYSAESVHNGYELERVFGLKLNMLSNYYDKETWGKIVENRKKGIILPQTLLDMGVPIVMFEGRLHVNQEPFSGKIIMPDTPHLGFHPEYLDLPYENVYYHAEWGSKKWFLAYEKENRKELTFPELPDQKNRKYADQIRSCLAVGIHIRRKTFVPEGLALPCEYYRDACKRVLDEYPDAHFFVFSDELDWCRTHEAELGLNLCSYIAYIEGNCEPNNYIDMQLLSMCRGIVRNEISSFSQVAGWLSEDLLFDMKLRGNSPRQLLAMGIK